jgi:hypothetical protein
MILGLSLTVLLLSLMFEADRQTKPKNQTTKDPSQQAKKTKQ